MLNRLKAKRIRRPGKNVRRQEYFNSHDHLVKYSPIHEMDLCVMIKAIDLMVYDLAYYYSTVALLTNLMVETCAFKSVVVSQRAQINCLRVLFGCNSWLIANSYTAMKTLFYYTKLCEISAQEFLNSLSNNIRAVL